MNPKNFYTTYHSPFISFIDSQKRANTTFKIVSLKKALSELMKNLSILGTLWVFSESYQCINEVNKTSIPSETCERISQAGFFRFARFGNVVFIANTTFI